MSFWREAVGFSVHLRLAFGWTIPRLPPRMISLGSLNPQQREAVLTTDGPVLILAGAGTGKTRVITHRIAYMVSQGIQRSHILAVTFTNKAAREMQERVAELLPKQPKPPRKPKGEEGPAPERPTVCTFHSLCVRILRQQIERLGYKKGFVIFDHSDQLGAVKKILSQISAKGEKTDPGAVLAMLSRFRNGGSQARGFEEASVVALDRKSTRLNSSHGGISRMPSSA